MKGEKKLPEEFYLEHLDDSKQVDRTK